MSKGFELPEKDFSRPNTDQGIYRKFEVRRTDCSDLPGGKHDGCEYFVLDLTHDPHAKEAASAYADAVEATHPELAADMRERYGLTPRQLAEQRAELLEALRKIMQVGDYGQEYGIPTTGEGHAECREIAEDAIANATQQREENENV